MMTLRINGLEHELDVPDDMPLLWVLRDVVGLTGTKFGCGVVQCGYCQPGQIMSAAALIESNPNPSDADIDAAMSGNICRCGTYTRIRTAIKQASQSA